MSASTIVVAEDDRSIGELVTHHLEREGFVVRLVSDGHAALRAARACADLLLLDVGLPGIDGFEVARTLRRERCEVPILMLSARVDEVDRVVGLELGADDYVCKPFSPRELVARVRAVVRRTGRLPEQEPVVLEFGRLCVCRDAREVRVDGRSVRIKPREFLLLLELARNAGKALSREHLVECVWGVDYFGDERTLDVHIRRIREKVEEAHELGPLIETIRGFGYKFIAV